MNRDDIIRMAREADSGFDGGPNADGTMTDSLVGFDAIERFAHAAYEAGAAAERDQLRAELAALEVKTWNQAIEAAAEGFELDDGHYYDQVRDSILRLKK